LPLLPFPAKASGLKKSDSVPTVAGTAVVFGFIRDHIPSLPLRDRFGNSLYDRPNAVEGDN
jgi:hypothetical protein